MYSAIYREMAAHGRMSTKSLADRLGLNEKTMGRKLAGKSHFTIDEMFAIQDLFDGIPLDELFARDESGRSA